MNTTAGKWKVKYPDYVATNVEGWGIFDTSTQNAIHNRYELQRLDEESVFGDDEEAQQFVFDQAEKGNRLHIQALVFLCCESPNEIDSIIRRAVGSERLDKFLKQHNISL